MSVVEGLKIQIHVCGILRSFGLVYSIDWVRQCLNVFSLDTRKEDYLAVETT